MAPVKMWTPYIPHLYTDFFWSIQKRDKFIPNYFELLSIYEIIYIRLFSIYIYLMCVARKVYTYFLCQSYKRLLQYCVFHL